MDRGSRLRRGAGVALALALALSAGAASAQTVADWDGRKAEDQAFWAVYLRGVASGLLTAEVYAGLESGGATRLYCQPERLGLTPDQTVAILQGQIDRDRAEGVSIDTVGVATELLLGLKHTFPCD